MFTYDRFQMFEGPAPHVSCRGAGNAEFFYLEKKSHLPTYKYAKWGESAKICFFTTWSSIYDDKCGDCRTPFVMTGKERNEHLQCKTVNFVQAPF